MTDFSSRTTLQAVMPLALEGSRDGNDLARAVTQGRTLRHFFRHDELLCVNVVGRAHELPQIAAALKPLETDWLQYRLIDEIMVHPGMTGLPVSGWHKQQVVKMAAPEWLRAPLWLTLDADVICTQPFGVDDVAPGGRGLLSVDDVNETSIYQRWAWASREVLGMATPPISISTSITPLTYAAPIMRACYQVIEAVHGRPWKDVLLDAALVAGLVQRYGQGWTENQVYHTVGARFGMLRTYHAISGIDVAHSLVGGGIWRDQDWPDWNVEAAFRREHFGIFQVCSSYTGMPAEFVATKVEPFLKETAPEPRPFHGVLLDEAVEKRPTGSEFRGRILCRKPLVVLGPFDEVNADWTNILAHGVLQPLQHLAAVVIVTLPYSREAAEKCKLLAARIARRQREAPQHRFIVLCNTEVEVENFRQLGLNAALVSHNALLDERNFLSHIKVQPEFDAVYNAGFHPAKRHQLAAQIDSLALIYANWHDLPENAQYAAEAKQALAHAVHLNRPRPQDAYRYFKRHELAGQLQRARVGLCLSEEEGSMRASMEYLFAGLPLVSTFSRGGRDQFFDADYCAVVPPDPAMIAQAVRELAARNVPRSHVQRRTMHKLTAHRERMVQIVQQAIASLGHQGRAGITWPWWDYERTFTAESFRRELLAEPAS
ncbi:MAG: hypothetical protein K0S54_1037 [Alphaproteobacteria bacterium]|nr:hypothetical protein [Alphaproteobacteria bacterium]